MSARRIAWVVVAVSVTLLAHAFLAAETAYEARWCEATHALAAFGIARGTLMDDQGRVDRAELAAAYRRERDRLAAALAALRSLAPPREHLLRHWQLVPLYEQALVAMNVVIEGAEKADDAALATGWSLYRNTTSRLRLMAEL